MRTCIPQAGRTAGAVRAALSTRRAVLRTAFGATVIAGTAAVLAPILGRKASAGPAHAPPPATEGFSEMYLGRHIEALVPSGTVKRLRDPVRAHAHLLPEVLIDGRPLHVMRCANGGYMSVVNHYETFPTLLDAARAAVDDLGPARLSRTSAHTT
ncbi:tyrosinase family oxidase copper chaperone [Streptomyces sp. NPDC058657]|uniref:tyrosinase family oxidase copper chaperone n=1 Tax=unclassified Streptomyces TaxID=2593676 RepID=UPI00364FBF6F